MRAFVLTASIVAIGSPALASSITELSASGRTTSIVEKGCRACDQGATSIKKVDGPGVYHVPSLGPDIQTTEIRAVNGEEKLVRTEAWLGGSPVTFISKLPAWMTTQQHRAEATLPVRSGPVNTARAVAPSHPDGIDAATTAAVGDAGESALRP